MQKPETKSFPLLKEGKKSTMIIIIIIIIPKSFWLIVLLNLAYELLYCTSFNEKNNIFFCYKKPLMTPFQMTHFGVLVLIAIVKES